MRETHIVKHYIQQALLAVFTFSLMACASIFESTGASDGAAYYPGQQNDNVY